MQRQKDDSVVYLLKYSVREALILGPETGRYEDKRKGEERIRGEKRRRKDEERRGEGRGGEER